MKLTKENAVRNHRKMWKWIAARIENEIRSIELENKRKMQEEKSKPKHLAKTITKLERTTKTTMSINKLKQTYLTTYFPKTRIKHSCFCCEYACQQSHSRMNFCEKCPLDWGNPGYFSCLYLSSKNTRGLLEQCKTAKTLQEQAALARRIAALPKR